ncbi:DUF3267 domain-containing protein [Salinicoccus hispanicus]|uniref:DUF3267 domain-containing protein n=1 Tax=Salinicoccus hispanicus TaxID=157225 RepID=A0A6N8U1F1_9STAP|nr:DUF3267 domain-containing protein [Salinicoccus hispanicus]MXQ51900.1 DUF3267 domain-containing protein [Salinicoccus hispanicus]
MSRKYVFDIFKDKTAMRTLNTLAIGITIALFLPFLIFDVLFMDDIGSALVGKERFGIFGAVFLIIAIMFAVITAHEAIHGIFFKVFAPKGRVRFGYKAGLFYAAAPGEIFTKRHFATIIMMPFVIITTVLLILMFSFPHVAYKYLIALHTGACAGDFYYIYLLYKYRHMEYVEDTDVGMTIYETHPRMG